MIFASRAGNLHLLEERVLAGGNVNYNDSQHGSALIEAITHRHFHILDWLITNQADVNVQYHDGLGPLEIALTWIIHKKRMKDENMLKKKDFDDAAVVAALRRGHRQRLYFEQIAVFHHKFMNYSG